MKAILRSTTIVAVSAIFVWACFGFMAWDWSPSNWKPAGRGFALVLSLFLSFLLMLPEHWEGSK